MTHFPTIYTGDFEGDKYIDIFTGKPWIEVWADNHLVVDARGNPTYHQCTRIYADEVPGGPAWPPARITTAQQMIQAALPAGFLLVDVNEDPGKAHITMGIIRNG